MTIETKFNIGDKVKHQENGLFTVEEISIFIGEENKEEPSIIYEGSHREIDGSAGDFWGSYYESEIK